MMKEGSENQSLTPRRNLFLSNKFEDLHVDDNDDGQDRVGRCEREVAARASEGMSEPKASPTTTDRTDEADDIRLRHQVVDGFRINWMNMKNKESGKLLWESG